MSGAFYGSLAASASVFVAILTALLVNNYVRIKSDRRQTTKELSRVKEQLDGLQDRKDEYDGLVDPLVEKREFDYIEKAEEQVDEFIESDSLIESGILKRPIEKLTVDELYQNLLEFYDCESPEDLEEEPVKFRHRDILERRLSEIEDRALNNLIPPFASDYEGDGWEPDYSSNFNQLVESVREENEVSGEEAQETESEEPDIVVESEFKDRDILELDEFINEYKEQYDLNTLNDKTLDKLEEKYLRVVSRPPPSDHATESLHNILGSKYSGPSNTFGPSDSFRESVTSAVIAAEAARPVNDPIHEIDFAVNEPVLGLNSQEQQKLDEAQQELRDIEIEIKTLENRKDRLAREKDRLQPGDLLPTLTANVATIVLSVVIPIFAYLLNVTNTTITVPQWAWIITHTEVNVFFSWLLGLFVVFESIHARIHNRDPRAYSLYKRARGRLFSN